MIDQQCQQDGDWIVFTTLWNRIANFEGKIPDFQIVGSCTYVDECNFLMEPQSSSFPTPFVSKLDDDCSMVVNNRTSLVPGLMKQDCSTFKGYPLWFCIMAAWNHELGLKNFRLSQLLTVDHFIPWHACGQTNWLMLHRNHFESWCNNIHPGCMFLIWLC